MPDAVLIFTFSPVQSFIGEARRAADLYVGSQVLVTLARAAAQAIERQGGALIYPSQVEGDMPNKIVARVPFANAQTMAEEAKKSLLQAWQQHVKEAHERLAKLFPPPDEAWEEVWNRQTARLWEIYWAAAAMGDEKEYPEAYRQASSALDAVKRTRTFEASEEEGMKDTLSGRRSALHTQAVKNAKAYWKTIGERVTAAKLRPEGRERLDAIGAVKRFCHLADRPFLSVSSVASRDFLAAAVERAGPQLDAYRAAVEALIGKERLFRVREAKEWPYDGDLLYMETLTQERLKDGYGLESPDAALLRQAQESLRVLYKEVGQHPSPYYGIVVLDGDSIGKHISKCLETDKPEEAHRAFSRQLTQFAGKVKETADKDEPMATLIYNGGDDVLALAPLRGVIPFAWVLAKMFEETTKGATASAGIAIAHHLYPLDAALRAAREAERAAKNIEKKDAVCVRVLRRSGEMTQARCKWEDLGERLEEAIRHFADDALSSKVAYDVLSEARTVNGLADHNAWQAMLQRLVKRHKTAKLADAKLLAENWLAWAKRMGAYIPYKAAEAEQEPQGGLVELGRWLVLARFVAQGGGD